MSLLRTFNYRTRLRLDHGLAVIWEAVHPSNDLMTLLVNDLKTLPATTKQALGYDTRRCLGSERRPQAKSRIYRPLVAQCRNECNFMSQKPHDGRELA